MTFELKAAIQEGWRMETGKVEPHIPSPFRNGDRKKVKLSNTDFNYTLLFLTVQLTVLSIFVTVARSEVLRIWLLLKHCLR